MSIPRILRAHWTLRDFPFACWIVLLAGGFVAGTSERVLASNQPASRIIEQNLLDLPSSRAALQKMNQPVTVVWDQKRVREAMLGLSESQGLSLWMDRRIDPNQVIVLRSQSGETLGTIFEKVEKQLEVEIGLVGNVFVVCPQGRLAKLQYAAIDFHDQLSRAAPNRANVTRRLNWQELATPNELLDDCVQTLLTVEGQLPHDLLHAGELEQSVLATQLVLISGGFDLAPSLTRDPQTLYFKPLGKPQVWRTEYELAQLNNLARKTRELATRCRRVGGRAVRQGERLVLSGPTSLHLLLLLRERSPPLASKKGDPFENEVFTFEVKNESLDAALKSLAYGLGLELKWDEGVEAAKASTLISVSTEREPIDAVLAKLATAANVKIRRKVKSVTVSNP